MIHFFRYIRWYVTMDSTQNSWSVTMWYTRRNMSSILHYNLYFWRYEALKMGRDFLDTLYLSYICICIDFTMGDCPWSLDCNVSTTGDSTRPLEKNLGRYVPLRFSKVVSLKQIFGLKLWSWEQIFAKICDSGEI